MVDALEAFGIRVEAAHHEVAAGPARDRLRVRGRAADRRQRDHLQVRAQGDRPAARPVRDVHAQADPRDQRLRDAHPPEPVLDRRRAERVRRRRPTSTGCPTWPGRTWPASSPTPAGMIAVLAPLVNSYKRLVPGLRGADVPDLGPDEPLGAHPGADGLARQVDRGDPGRGPLPGPVVEHLPRVRGDDRGRSRRRREGPRSSADPVEESLFEMDAATIAAKGIRELPGHARRGARRARERDAVIREALGDHVFSHFVEAKRAEWDEYRTQVSRLGGRALPRPVLGLAARLLGAATTARCLRLASSGAQRRRAPCPVP